jgi:hypothetical protein
MVKFWSVTPEQAKQWSPTTFPLAIKIRVLQIDGQIADGLEVHVGVGNVLR